MHGELHAAAIYRGPAAYWVYEDHNMDSNIIEYVRTVQDVCQSVSSKDHPEPGRAIKRRQRADWSF